MALQPLPQPFTDAAGRITFFIGNQAIAVGKLRVARLDGTGSDLLSTTALTVNGRRILVLWAGDSHVANGGSPTTTAARLAASGAYVGFNPTDHVFAVGGAKSYEVTTNQLPLILGYLSAHAADYDEVIVCFDGGINDGTYAPSLEACVEQVVTAKRTMSRALALAGARVVLLLTPPTVLWLSANPANPTQQAIQDGSRLAYDQDAITHYRDEYGAVAVTDTYAQDARFYPASAHYDYPADWGDVTHNTAPAMVIISERHWLPKILEAARYVSPARLAPTAMQVDATNKTLSFTKTVADSVYLHEFSVDSGASWTTVSNYPVDLPDGSYSAGAIKVRVAEYADGVAGPALSSIAAYTVGTVLPPYVPGTFVDQVFATGTKRVNALVSGNNWTQADTGTSLLMDTREFTGDGALRVTLKLGLRGVGYALRTTASLPSPGNVADAPACLQVDTGSFAFYFRTAYTFTPFDDAATTCPYAENDVLELARVGDDCVIKLNGVRVGGAVGLYAGQSHAMSAFCFGVSTIAGGTDMKIMGASGLSANSL